MKTLLLASAALVVATIVGWWVLAAPPSPGGGGPGPADASPGEGGGGAGASPADGTGSAGGGPGPAKDGGTSGGRPLPPPRERDPDFWKKEVDGVPPREPGPVPEGGPGDRFDPESMKEEDREKATALFDRLHEAQVGKLAYRSRALESVLRDLEDRTRVKLELASEDLEDEPVDLEIEGIPLIDALRHICLTRNLRFEIKPDRVVVSR